ncbi:MAG: preprotein translocase subunit SecG [Cytophagaceae bacterium]
MTSVIIGLILFVCFLLVVVILSQNSKGGGLAGNFGAGSAQLMGVKKTGDLLEKLTWGFAITVVALSIIVNLIYKNAAEDAGFDSPVIQQNESGQELPGGVGNEGQEDPAAE